MTTHLQSHPLLPILAKATISTLETIITIKELSTLQQRHFEQLLLRILKIRKKQFSIRLIVRPTPTLLTRLQLIDPAPIIQKVSLDFQLFQVPLPKQPLPTATTTIIIKIISIMLLVAAIPLVLLVEQPQDPLPTRKLTMIHLPYLNPFRHPQPYNQVQTINQAISTLLITTSKEITTIFNEVAARQAFLPLQALQISLTILTASLIADQIHLRQRGKSILKRLSNLFLTTSQIAAIFPLPIVQ